MASADGSRLFLALWPGEAMRAAIFAHAEAWAWPPGAARVRGEKLHLTLHFLGDVPRERVPALLEAVRTLPFTPFELVLQRVEVWNNGVAVLRPLVVPPALRDLHAAAGDRLQSLGHPREARAYRPHVTLARRAFDATASPARLPIHWSPPPPVLVEAEPFPPRRYRVLGSAEVW